MAGSAQLHMGSVVSNKAQCPCLQGAYRIDIHKGIRTRMVGDKWP